MLIKTDTRIIQGEHLGIPFKYEGGYLTINGQTYSKAEIKALVNIANLLELEGFKMADTKPLERRKNWSSIKNQLWGIPFQSFDEPSEEE